jgi:hypothetical protein
MKTKTISVIWMAGQSYARPHPYQDELFFTPRLRPQPQERGTTAAPLEHSDISLAGLPFLHSRAHDALQTQRVPAHKTRRMVLPLLGERGVGEGG